MIAGFRKPKRGNIRAKKVALSEDEEENDSDSSAMSALSAMSAPVISESAPKLKPDKLKKIKKTSGLSFGDELEEGEEFTIRRSKASLKLQEAVKHEKLKKKKKQKNSDPQSSQLPTLPPPPLPPVADISLDFSHVVAVPDEDDELTTSTEVMDVQHRFNQNSKVDIGKGAIPDAATIYALKKKREYARVHGTAPGYVPLDDKYQGRFNAENSSRLVREDMDYDSSGDERVEMRGGSEASHPALERRKAVARALEAADENLADDENQNDDEFQRWEDEQIRKGRKAGLNGPDISHGDPLSSMSYSSSAASVGIPSLPLTSQMPFVPNVGMTFSPPVVAIPSIMPTANVRAVSADMVLLNLREQLQTRQELHRIHELERDKLSMDLIASRENIITFERRSEDTADKFSFYQDMRGYVKDLIECLSEKIKRADDFESTLHQTLAKRTEKLTSRRQNDVKDELEQISGKSKSDSDRINNIKQRRTAEREARRNRRREARRAAGVASHEDGLSSDDELLESDTLRFKADYDKVLKEADALFADVIEDFSHVGAIMDRFEQWKLAYTESYKEAFLSLCLPKLLAPFIKLELLTWDPFEVQHGTNLQDCDWYQTLALYGQHAGDIEEDSDLMLLPSIVEKVVVPKLTVLVESVWDPLSSKQTKGLTDLIQQLIEDYPTLTKDSKYVKLLVEAIASKLKNSVENDLFIPLYPKSLLEARNSPARLFLERQFWVAYKLLSNLMQWNWLLSRKKLQELGVDGILNRYLTIALQQMPDTSSSLEYSKLIVGLLPKEWFESSETVVAGLESFARFLTSLASTVVKNCLGYTEVEKKKAKITITKIISLLMHLQAFDSARTIAKEYKSATGGSTVDNT